MTVEELLTRLQEERTSLLCELHRSDLELERTPSSQMTTFDYDDTDIHARYARARKLPDAAIALCLQVLSRHVADDAVDTVVDLGCGTGRFIAALGEHFRARVYGIDPSTRMLSVAQDTIADPRVEFREGAAESIPLDDNIADLIFLSMVYHHTQDKVAACQEFARLLRPNGYLCIRTSTRERLDSYLWMSFFPQALEIERRRIPGAEELTGFLERQGFMLRAHDVYRQVFARDLNDYCERIALRALSSLQSIPDETFESGLSELREYCASQDTDRQVYEDVDLFVFNSASE